MFLFREVVREKRHRQHVLETLFMHTQRRLLAAAMQAWLQHTRALAAARSEAANMAAQQRHEVLLDALVGWKHVVDAQQARRALLAKAVMRIAACRLRWALGVWKDHTDDALLETARAQEDESAQHVAYDVCCRKLQVMDFCVCEKDVCVAFFLRSREN